MMQNTKEIRFENQQIIDCVKLQFGDGPPDVYGLKIANAFIHSAGVYLGLIEMPVEAKTTLKSSFASSIAAEESKELIHLFYLNRKHLLGQVRFAGREPEVHLGGYLSTSEIGSSHIRKFMK